jgi:DNA-binding MarR family transcriptional regulator
MDLFDAVVRYETALWNHLEDSLREAGAVSLPQLESLRVVHRHAGRARVHEISRELLITPGAASKLADRLERAGLVERRPNPDDRRSALLVLTAAGRRKRTEAERVTRTAMRVHLSGSDVDVDALTATLVALRERLAPTTATMTGVSA